MGRAPKFAFNFCVLVGFESEMRRLKEDILEDELPEGCHLAALCLYSVNTAPARKAIRAPPGCVSAAEKLQAHPLCNGL